jgi:dTDP-glucose 4,6-dehydratase
VRILVTGGAGFLGSHYVRTLLTGGYPGFEDARVTVLDALTYAGSRANLAPVEDAPRLTFVHGDVTDGALLAGVVPGHDAVVHFAAESHVDRSLTGAHAFVRTNVLGTQLLLQAALDAAVSRFVHVSTDEVYGSIASGSWTEESPLDPRSPYAASKASSDLMARAYAHTFGLPVCVTRGTNTYGPYQYPEKVVPLFVTNLLDGRSVPLYGDGLHVRDWLHVDDHCRGVQRVLEKGAPGETYHVGGGTELTNRALTQHLLDACGADWSRVEPVPDRKGHDRRYSVDWTRLAGLGYAPRRTLTEGLAETVAWYRDHRAWWEPLKARAGLA